MEFKEFSKDKSNIDDKTEEIINEFSRIEKEFGALTGGMFNKQNAVIFNRIVPEKYLPEKIRERIKDSESLYEIMMIYKEANLNYKQIIFLNSCNPNYFSYC